MQHDHTCILCIEGVASFLQIVHMLILVSFPDFCVPSAIKFFANSIVQSSCFLFAAEN